MLQKCISCLLKWANVNTRTQEDDKAVQLVSWGHCLSTTRNDGSVLLFCRITKAQLLAAASESKESRAVHYLLCLQPEAECQRFLWIHGDSWIPSYTEKIKKRLDVILLTPHYRCPTPQTPYPPHPPLSGRTDGCPSQSLLHTPSSQPGTGSRYIWWMGPWTITVQATLSSTVVCCGGLMMYHSLFWRIGSKLCVMSFFSSPQATCKGAPPLWLAGAPSNSCTDGLLNWALHTYTLTVALSTAAFVCKCTNDLNNFVFLVLLNGTTS